MTDARTLRELPACTCGARPALRHFDADDYYWAVVCPICRTDAGWHRHKELAYAAWDKMMAPPSSPPPPSAPEPHPDDVAVDRYAAALKAKLAAARAKGRSGWDDPDVISDDQLVRDLVAHLAKGNPGTWEDIGAYAMMCHQRRVDPGIMAHMYRGVARPALDPIITTLAREMAATMQDEIDRMIIRMRREVRIDPKRYG
ncbi:hypothetical protein P7L78_22075 [Tistrella bauzanensis]|uniref:hypothetical protein n=1 Tax=Tistrella TaxID=171436 RepID=UPI0031F61AF8